MKLADYIIMRRSAQIINNLICNSAYSKKSFYYSPISQDMSNIIDGKCYIGSGEDMSKVLFQRRLEDMFRLVFEGCNFSRVIAIDKSADDSRDDNIIPMYLLEVFEPSHCYVPIYVTEESIMAISPFNNLAIERLSKNQYLIEILPTPILLDGLTEPGLEKLNAVLDQVVCSTAPSEDGTPGEQITYRRYILDMILLFNQGIKRQDAMMTRGFGDVDYNLVEEVSEESERFKRMRKVFSFEEFDKINESSDDVINPTDFMPIYVTHKGDSGFAILKDKYNEKGERKVGLAIKPHVVGLTDTSGVQAILTKENSEGKKFFIMELHDFHYIGDNTIVHYNYYEGKIEDRIKVIELQSAVIDDTSAYDYTVGQEGVMDKIRAGGSLVKDALFVIKKFGVKHGSYFGGLISQVFKEIGVKNAKWALAQFGSTFKRGIELEKADTLELQEKLLNDELDSMEERITGYTKTWFRTCSLTVFMGGMIFFPLAWLISRSRTKKARVRAMDRLEVRFDNIIERLERKINYAEERSENESVDQLIKERQMYQMARMRLLRLKDDAYDAGRVKYATFDKDLTMTASQRLDAYLTKGGNRE